VLLLISVRAEAVGTWRDCNTKGWTHSSRIQKCSISLERKNEGRENKKERLRRNKDKLKDRYRQSKAMLPNHCGPPPVYI
jgi:hypothetical protein